MAQMGETMLYTIVTRVFWVCVGLLALFGAYVHIYLYFWRRARRRERGVS